MISSYHTNGISKNWIQKIYELNQFQFKSIDLNKEIEVLKKVINEFQPEIIVNFASQGMVAESWLNPSHWYQTNLMSQVTFMNF